MRACWSLFPLLVVALLALIPPISAHAQDAGGITVSGSARVTGKPNSAEISVIVSGEAELTADAIVKYRDARKRAVASIEGLKISGLSIDSAGVSVKEAIDPMAQQQAIQRGLVTSAGKQKISVSEQLRLVVRDIDKMEQSAVMETLLKVLDTAKDSGLTIGDGTPRNYNSSVVQTFPLIKFKISDPSALRQQAYKQAMDDAKAKAQRLAEMSGLKIGRIISVRDSIAPSPQSQQDPNELVSAVLDEIPLALNLSVQFEIQK